MYIYIHIYTHMYVYIYICIHTYVCIYMCVCIIVVLDNGISNQLKMPWVRKWESRNVRVSSFDSQCGPTSDVNVGL